MAEAEIAVVPTTLPDDAQPEPRSLLERLIEQDHVRAIEKIDAMTKVLDHLRLAAIRSTYVSDWVVHAAYDRDGNKTREVAYLMDCGAERAGKVFGIEVGTPIVEREDFRDDDPPTFSYNMIAEARSKVTGERNTYEGSRWSGDKFFTSRLKEGERQDPVEIRKASYANLHGRAVRALGGLKDVPLDMLKQAGLDVTKILNISYGGAAGGSSAAVGGSDLTIAWGKDQGKKLSELDDRALAYHLDRETKALTDPAKARYVKKTQRMVDGLKAEVERRKAIAEQAAESGAEPAEPAEKPAPPPAGSRGEKLSRVHAALKESFSGGNMRHALPYLGSIVERGVEAVSDLNDTELDSVLAHATFAADAKKYIEEHKG